MAKEYNRYLNLLHWRRANPDYQRGNRNPAWKGGTSRSTVRRLAKRVLEQANVNMYICSECAKVSHIRHNIHHIDGNRSNNTLTNLEVLCSRCHNSGWRGARHARPRDKRTGRFIQDRASRRAGRR